MPFDPRDLTDIPDADRAKLTAELGEQTVSDAQRHILSLSRMAQAGNDDALRTLVASAAASLAVSILGHVSDVLTNDPNHSELRLAMQHIPGVERVAILAAMQAAIVAFGDMRGEDRAAPSPTEHLVKFHRELEPAQAIACTIWEEVRDFCVQDGHGVGTRTSAKGASIFVVPRK